MKAPLAAWAALLEASAACAQEAAPVFHATSELVLLDVQVIHRKTKTALGSLQAKDFELYEDGVAQQIAFFDHDQLPLSIVFLFDLTDSVRGVLRRLAAGARSALDHLKPEDETAVMAYAASAHVVDGFTTDRQRTADAITRAAGMKQREAAFFNEAVYRAACLLEQSRNPSSRRVVIWLTDNFPNAASAFNRRHYGQSLGGAPPHSEEEALRELHESGTVVAALLLKDPLAVPWASLEMAIEAPARKRNPAGDARKYAELTGGIALGRGGKKVEDRLAEIIDDLRSRYTIGYRPSETKPAGTFCKLRVALAPGAPLRPQEWTVIARAGYYRK